MYIYACYMYFCSLFKGGIISKQKTDALNAKQKRYLLLCEQWNVQKVHMILLLEFLKKKNFVIHGMCFRTFIECALVYIYW